MPVFHTQNVLNGGEISPLLRGRVDQPRYSTGAREMSNFVPMPQGGVTRRPGTRYLGTALGDDGRLVPFVFSATQGRMLEFGDRTMLAQRLCKIVLFLFIIFSMLCCTVSAPRFGHMQLGHI